MGREEERRRTSRKSSNPMDPRRLEEEDGNERSAGVDGEGRENERMLT